MFKFNELREIASVSWVDGITRPCWATLTAVGDRQHRYQQFGNKLAIIGSINACTREWLQGNIVMKGIRCGCGCQQFLCTVMGEQPSLPLRKPISGTWTISIRFGQSAWDQIYFFCPRPCEFFAQAVTGCKRAIAGVVRMAATLDVLRLIQTAFHVTRQWESHCVIQQVLLLGYPLSAHPGVEGGRLHLRERNGHHLAALLGGKRGRSRRLARLLRRLPQQLLVLFQRRQRCLDGRNLLLLPVERELSGGWSGRSINTRAARMHGGTRSQTNSRKAEPAETHM